jgi:hypothetical protein
MALTGCCLDGIYLRLEEKDEKSLILTNPDSKTKHIEPTKPLCTCDFVELMRYGCKCGGI